MRTRTRTHTDTCARERDSQREELPCVLCEGIVPVLTEVIVERGGVAAHGGDVGAVEVVRAVVELLLGHSELPIILHPHVRHGQRNLVEEVLPVVHLHHTPDALLTCARSPIAPPRV
jgi:hypothetical protein